MSTLRTPADALLNILRRNNEARASIMRRPQQPTPQPPQEVTFYDHVLATYFNGDEETMLTSLAVSRPFFVTLLNMVDSVRLQTRGRRGFVQTHKDKLLFLVVFFKKARPF